ncbi:MAG: methionine adenosyltransferase [Chloroflexi bacterium AL-W]|nr:methionine adenosyltransferase [Chloroflexi bacterium AL-N1]NOK65587.1 methionine adenosyltransferase [Chloroflexi bacterium AL-N10]NOK74472.1 methionine adenosyltransferase [Chloroflexi bacterium AL-N5]NOK80620.1 methionine adenosyltransferase [Chloroflexi bacterium AL-W]NOK88730.1 methionine adenosyltransferase [Chloroflexi bacterium AL-N15]
MPTSFMQSPQLFFTSESVTEGHPDKLCDQVSDAILDAFLAQDPRSRVACETAATTGLILVMGEVTTEAYVEIQEIVRQTVREIGYTGIGSGFDADTCGVIVSLHGQSADIALGVDKAHEAKLGQMSEAEIEAVGAGDQGMMIGFACNETPELMPLTTSLSHRMARQLAAQRKSGALPYLGPDGKSQVTVEYAHGKPIRVDTVLVSTQHTDDVSQEQIREDIIEDVINAIIPAELLDDKTKYYVNPTGRFVTGGPHGDAGLTGRKIIVDTYGGVARHGGGAFSGKDPTKVDRSAAYAARYVAKNVVAAGLADRFEVQVSYAIGVAHPLSISIETFGTGKVAEETIQRLINEHFDLRPGAIIRDLDLRRPIYRPTAAYGHFGRDDIDTPWERTDKAEVLRKAAGL